MDVANPCYREKMAVVEQLLQKLELGDLPRMTLFNKIDLVEDREVVERAVGAEGFTVSALEPETLREFLIQAERMIGKVLADRSHSQIES